MKQRFVFIANTCITLFILLCIGACTTSRTALNSEDTRTCVVMSINDVYRINGVYEGREGGLARVRTLRTELEKQYPDLIFLHAGDFLFPSLLSATYDGKQMISILNLMDRKEHAYDDRFFVTFGNHEFEKARLKDTTLLQALIDSSEFVWLGSNVDFKKNSTCEPMIESGNIMDHTIVNSGGIKVGLFSLTTDVKFPAYVQSFGNPIETARNMTALLRRKGAEVVVALTHLNVSQDKEVLQTLGSSGPDLIIGGHEHDEQSHLVNGRYVLKANADATSTAVAKITLRKGSSPQVTFEFKEIGSSMATDDVVQQKVDWWMSQYDRDYCKNNNLPEGCTNEVYGTAQVDLIAEELEIRKYETNMGNWIADQALNAFRDKGAQIAFLNSGSIRLNQNIVTGQQILRRHINEMFPYQNKLKLIQITGADLQKVVNRSVTDWTGNGWWLQIAGFAYIHNPDGEKGTNLTLLTPTGPRIIKPDDKLLAVTTDYLLDPAYDQDGYTMLKMDMVVAGSESPVLTEVVINGLKTGGSGGIMPQVEGRICNTQKQTKCLAMVGNN